MNRTLLSTIAMTVFSMFAATSAFSVEACVPDEAYPVSAGQIRGASLFEQYCALCHGKRANGKGRAARLHTPPPANLRKTVMPAQYLEQIIRLGGEAMDRGIGMPPWKDELSDSQITDLVNFIEKARDVEKIRQKHCPESLESGAELDKKDTRKDKFHPAALIVDDAKFRGAQVFENHCVFCHGPNADGKSRSAAFLKPPPANLLTSKLTHDELQTIINGGGAALDRSDVMPAWGDSLTGEQISDLIDFLLNIRSEK